MRDSRTARAVPAFVLAMLVSVWFAPAAHAQLGGGVGDVVGDTVGDVGGATGSVGDTVGGITDGLEGSSGGSGGEGETSGGGDSGGGLITGVIGGTKNAVEKTVDSGKETLEEVVTDTGDTLGNIGSDTLGGVVGTVEEAVVGATGKKKVRKSGTEDATSTSSPTANGSVVLGKDLADALRTDGQALTAAINDGRSFSVAPVDVPADESLVTQIGRIATEAARQAAFPLALALLVIAFLMVQNRLDRKDPKLALAPVDSEHDLLSFT